MQTASALRRHLRLGWNQDVIDAGIGVGLMVVAFLDAIAGGVQLDALSVPLLVLQTLPLALRRRAPIAILAVTGFSITAYSMLHYSQTAAGFGVLLAFYTVAANETRRRALISAAITAAGILISFVAFETSTSFSTWIGTLTFNYLAFGLVWFIGDFLRVRRAYTRELEARAIQLEREREEKAALAVAEERARIARELHDVVAHYVSVAVVQAGAARRVLDKDPPAARAAIEAVETAGRTALVEMRRMLEVLRLDDSGIEPQPSLAELDRLIERVRGTGLPVELTIEGQPRELPAALDLAAYRIVQEALTNTVKHAGRASARVGVRYANDALEVEVIDDGRGAAAPLLSGLDGAGHGLVGMRERVGLFGGTLEAGPVFPGGYRVRARMPLDAVEPGKAAAEAPLSPDHGRARGTSKGGGGAHRQESLVAPRVIPPLIGRMVPPHPAPVPETPSRRRSRGGDE